MYFGLVERSGGPPFTQPTRGPARSSALSDRVAFFYVLHPDSHGQLELDAQRGPLEILVIDSVERPVEDRSEDDTACDATPTYTVATLSDVPALVDALTSA